MPNRAVRIHTKSIKYLYVRSISRMHLIFNYPTAEKYQRFKFFLSPQIVNSKILELIPLSQIRNFVDLSANRKSANLYIVLVR